MTAPARPVNLIRNTLLSAVSNLSNLFLFVLLLVIGWMLGVDQLGVFTFVIAFVTFFEIFVDFGLRDIGVRNISRDLSLTEKYLGNLFVWQIILSALSFLVMMAVTLVLGYQADLRFLIALFGLEAFLKKIKFTGRIFFQAHNRFEWDTLLVIFERASLLVFSIIALLVFRSLAVLAWTFLLVRLVDVVLLYAVIGSKIVPLNPRLDTRFIMELQMEALPRGIYVVIFVLLSYTDTMMLERMTSFKEVGLYNAAYKIFEGIKIIPAIVYTAVFPRLSQLYKKDGAAFESLSRHIVKYLLILGLFFGGLLFYSSSEVISILFRRPEFLDATPILQMLMLGVMIYFPLWMLHMIMLASDYQKVILINGSISFVFNVITNYLVIPKYGALGAAATTVASHLILLFLAWRFINRRCFRLGFLHVAGRPLLAVLIVAVAVVILRIPPAWHWILGAAIFFCALVFLLRTFDRREIMRFKTEVRNRPGKGKSAVPPSI